MKYALQFRSYAGEKWEYTECPDGERGWDEHTDAEAALLRCAVRWAALAHRLVWMEDGEATMVVATYDPLKLWETA